MAGEEYAYLAKAEGVQCKTHPKTWNNYNISQLQKEITYNLQTYNVIRITMCIYNGKVRLISVRVSCWGRGELIELFP